MANKLGMTQEQMIEEIVFMREWEKYLMQNLGTEHYDMLCHGFARQKTKEAFLEMGVSEEEAEEICEKVEDDMNYTTEKQ